MYYYPHSTDEKSEAQNIDVDSGLGLSAARAYSIS